jgi:hypothetical protein
MASNNITARYAAEAQAGMQPGTEQAQSVRGGYYTAQAQLDHRAAHVIGSVPHTAPRTEEHGEADGRR